MAIVAPVLGFTPKSHTHSHSLRDVRGDGAVGEAIPESAGGDVFVPLDVVRNPRHVEA